jgi:PIN domain nuclease of toxin-antitoxin system
MLDTHLVIWLAEDIGKLTPRAHDAIEAERSRGDGLAISGITLFELAMAIKRRRISVRRSVAHFLQEVEANFIVKPVTGRIAIQAMEFAESYPKDPMDRIIGATSLVEGLALVTADGAIRNSGAIDTIW